MKRSLAALAFFAFASLTNASTGSYSMDTDVTKTDRPNEYLCTVTVSDLETGEVLTAPQLSLLAGSEAHVTMTPEKPGGREVDLRVLIASRPSRATVTLEVRRAGEVLAVQKTSIAIR